MTDGTRKAKEDAKRSFNRGAGAFDGCAPTQKQSDRIISLTREG